jgi:hypothetical protein
LGIFGVLCALVQRVAARPLTAALVAAEDRTCPAISGGSALHEHAGPAGRQEGARRYTSEDDDGSEVITWLAS